MAADRADDGRDDGDQVEDADDEHLYGVEDGGGCTELWEHLSEQRDED